MKSLVVSLFWHQPSIQKALPDWRCSVALAFSRGLLRAIEKPSLKVLQTVAGPVSFPLGELVQGDYACWEPAALWRTQWEALVAEDAAWSLVLDDTHIPKEHTRCTAGAYPAYSGQHKRVIKGHTFVMLLAVLPSGHVRLLSAQLWKPEGPRKLEMAQGMIQDLLGAGLKPHDVSFDEAYYQPGFCNWLTHQRLRWTTRAARNLKFFFPGGQEALVAQWQASVPLESWHYYSKLHLYAKAVTVAKHGLPPVRLVALKHLKRGQPERYILSNDLQAGVQTLIARYRRRWAIEVAFRFAKQKLGLTTYRYLSEKAAERHIALVGLTVNCLSELSRYYGLPIGRLKRLWENPVRTEGSRYYLRKEAA